MKSLTILVALVLLASCHSSTPQKEAEETTTQEKKAIIEMKEENKECLKISQGTICTREFMPTVCRVEMDGEVLSAEGGNPCQAKLNIQVRYCEENGAPMETEVMAKVECNKKD